MRVQADILDGGPDNCQATALRREDIDLIGALAHIDFPGFQSHWWSECVGAWPQETHKRSRGALRPQPSFAPLRDSAERTWLVIGCQLDQGLRLCRLLPDSHEFSLDLAARSSWDRTQDVALLMHQAALARRGCKQFFHSCHSSIMTVSDNQIHLGGASCAQVLRASKPIHLCPPLRRLAVLTPLCFRSDPLPMPSK